jgi:5-(carboxyamino)imidazole ribonucleotide synthase
VRAICGLPLGPVEVLAPSRMENLIGEEANDWPRYLADPTARLHLYGKTSPRPGRKMGHVTFLKPS